MKTRFFVFISCVFLVSADHGFKQIRGPEFVHEPPNVVEFSNSTGSVIGCSARGQPEPTVRWIKRDGTPAAAIPGLREIRPDHSLVFFPFSRERYRQDVHSATYRCIASNKVGTIRSRGVHVKAVLQQLYDAHVSDHFIIRGSTAVLQCHRPPSSRDYVNVVLWLRDDGVSIGSPGLLGDKYSILPSGALLVHSVEPSDSLTGYQCQVHNRLTSDSKLSTTAGKIIVREPHTTMPPTITHSEPVLRGQETERVMLPCVGQGYPPPTYRWAKRDGDRVTLLHLSDRIRQKEGILIIKQLAIQDTGVYVCIINNTAGEDRAETKLLVSAPLMASIQPDRQTVDVGKSVTMSCHVTGHPVHSVVWLRNGRALSTTAQITLLSRDTLMINPVRKEDAGMYQCFVSNDQEVVQGSAELFVTEDAPVLLFAFSEQAVQPGTSVSLKCSASGNPLPQVTWQVDGYPVPEAYHIRVGDYVSDERTVNSYVNISGVSVEDGGTYKCIAQNGVNNVEHSRRLNVYGPPFIRPMKNITALDGHDVIIHCPASGYPITRIYWERDGRVLPHNHRQKPFPNGTLLIEELQRSRDNGIYQCVAENNRSRTAKREVSLNIMAPPVVEPFAFPAVIAEGRRTSAACIVSSGDLPIRITWMKDGKHLTDELEASIAQPTEYTSLLSFASVTQVHSGNYTCTATNPVASGNYSAPMLVRVPPKWKKEPTDKAVVMGQPAMFDCQATGYPDPVIRWKKALAELKSQFNVIISSDNVQILENGSLVIKEASKIDSGKYMCQATNDVGPGLSTVVNLKVHVAAHFAEKFKAMTLTRGENLSILCRAIGEKPITLNWSKDRNPFNPSFEPRYVYEERIYSEGVEATLNIPSVNRKDSSLFTCLAQNAYGRDDTNFQVVVQEPPDHPANLEASNKGSRSMTISWTPPYSGNSIITKYTIEYKKTDEPWVLAKEVAVDAVTSTHTLQGLTPYTSYDFRIKATNTVGSSDFSNVMTATTDGEAPANPPREVKAIATTSRTIQVSWKPPEQGDTHTPVDGYYVGYKSHSSNQYSYKTMQTFPGGSLECEITSLEKHTMYWVIVQAFNSKGAGPPSEEVSVHTLEFDPPAAPLLRVVSTTASSVHLSWTREQNPSPVSGYMLYQKSQAPDWEEVQLSEDRNSYVYHGLQCGMHYQFYLVAFNSAGRGEPSEVISATTEGTVPVAPDRKTLLSVNSTFVTIHLNSWHSGGCDINFFVVQYRSLNQAEWILLSNNILPEQETVTVTDLTPASHYMLLMTAHNDAGTTEAEYVFSTLTTTGGTVPPITASSENEREFFQQLKIVIPIACTTVVLVLIITVACVVLIRKRQGATEGASQDRGDVTKSVDTVPLSIWEKSARSSTRLSQSGEQLYFPAPYATSRISMYSADGEAESGQHHQQNQHHPQGQQQQQSQQQQQQPQHHHTWRSEEREHTYDVPFLPRQTVVPCIEVGRSGSRSNLSDVGQVGFHLGRHLYLNPVVVELPPDTTIPQDITCIPSSSSEKVKTYMYSKPMRRAHESKPKHRHGSRRARTTVIRRGDLELEPQNTVYYASDPEETSPSNGESFEFSEAECDMHLRLGMAERPV